jgi:hypothetical protein
MRRRLITCCAGAALGGYFGPAISDTLGLTAASAMALCAAAGLAVGYVVSMLLDVFSAKPHPLAIRDAD